MGGFYNDITGEHTFEVDIVEKDANNLGVDASDRAVTSGEASTSIITNRQSFIQEEPLNPITGISSPRDLRKAIFRIVVDGVDFKDGLGKFVTGVEVIENDDLAPRFRIELTNDRFALTNNPVLVEGARVQIWTGYLSTGIKYRGTFILDTPIHEAFNTATPKVILSGLGEISRMAKQKIQKVYANKTDAEIAQEIALKYGFDIDIGETPVRYDYIHQAGETDIAFLQRRALLHGFQTFLDSGQLFGNGSDPLDRPVFHYHKVRHIESGLQFLYNRGKKTNIYSVKIEVPTAGSAKVFKKAYFNPFGGKFTVTTSQDVLDDRTKKALDIFKTAEKLNTFKRPEDIGKTIGTDVGDRQLEFVVGGGDELTPEEAQLQLNAFAQANSYNIRGQFRSYGDERLRAGQSIRIFGLKKFDGAYYAKRVTHRIGLISGRETSYEVEVEIRSNIYQNQASSTPVSNSKTSAINEGVVAKGTPYDISGNRASGGLYDETSGELTLLQDTDRTTDSQGNEIRFKS